MDILLIISLTLSWAAANMFVSSDGYEKKLGWALPPKIWPIVFATWLVYPAFFINKKLFKSFDQDVKNIYEFAEQSLLYLAWISQIAIPFLVLLIAPWYYLFIVPIGGYLLSFLLFIILKRYTKTVSVFILIFIYLPLVVILLN